MITVQFQPTIFFMDSLMCVATSDTILRAADKKKRANKLWSNAIHNSASLGVILCIEKSKRGVVLCSDLQFDNISRGALKNPFSDFWSAERFSFQIV